MGLSKADYEKVLNSVEAEETQLKISVEINEAVKKLLQKKVSEFKTKAPIGVG